MLEKLEDRIKELGRVAIAYSGGIDSTFLLYVANKVLPKENVLAILAKGSMLAETDYNDALEFVRENNFNYEEVFFEPLNIPEFKENTRDRCYYCKKKLMTEIKNKGENLSFTNILDGKNADDLKGFRPGNRVASELNIISPLASLGFTKEMIRAEAKKLGLKTWNKPANSCLATRFPYHNTLSKELLKKVENAEKIIKNLGINKVRVRVHLDLIRIEVEKENFTLILNNNEAILKIKELGFKFITLDLFGLKSGSFD